MRNQKQITAKHVPHSVTFVNGNKHVTMQISNTRLEDWVDKSFLLKSLGICDKTLRTLRDGKKIPFGKLGGIYFYYLPGILFILEQGAAS